MAPKQDDGPYVVKPMGSILETASVLGKMLRPEGYSRSLISDMAASMFVANEHQSIRDSTPMHLIAIKKTLLYAIPVIASPDATTGITLTSQVASPAIQLRKDSAKEAGLASGDKFRLLGFAFPPRLVSHLAFNVFPQKYFYSLPPGFNDYSPAPIDLSFLKKITVKESKYGKLFLVDRSHYENAELFNRINRVLADRLTEELAAVIKASREVKHVKLPTLQRIAPFNKNVFIQQLNTSLEQQIEASYSMALYEVLHMTGNWLLYDQICLLGFESNEVKQQMEYLKYVKEQNLKVLANLRDTSYKRLLETRAAKIARDKYPFYFDYTDRRAIFVRFNQFSIDKLPQRDQQDVRILLEKDLAAQKALLLNKCEHIAHVKNLGSTPSLETFQHVETYVNYNRLGEDGMYSCKLCSFPLICVHTVELYDALSATPEGSSGSDVIYWANQKIINKFKLTNQRRTGEEDTEISFTYYCKHCGGELGKSNDVIQASIKTAAESSAYNESDPIDVAVYNGVSQAVASSMNASIMPLSKKDVVKLIYSEIKSDVMTLLKKASKREVADMDTMIRYVTHAYTIASLISLNINKIKSAQSILNGTGPALRDELIAALKLMQSVGAYKRIGVAAEKIKSMLVEAFQTMNRIFASESVVLKTISPKEKMALSIRCSPLAHYAMHIHKRFERSRSTDLIAVMGVDLDKLYPKKTKKDAKVKRESHALFRHMYEPSAKPTSDQVRYIIESYQPLVEFAQIEPTDGRYISRVTPALSEFVTKHQESLRLDSLLRRLTPVRFLPVENNREYDFRLKVYQIAYCLGDSARPHRWTIKKENNKLIYTCKHCQLNIDKAVPSNNAKIDQLLDEQMIIEAFFELYTISCPIKDAHIFDNNACSQCGVTKAQLDSMDAKYYSKYSSAYQKHRTSITDELIESAKNIMQYCTALDRAKLPVEAAEEADLVKLESVASNLNKLFSQTDLKRLGFGANSERQLHMVESYVRTFFSHYIFAKNVSINTKTHPDTAYFALIKKTMGGNLKSISMPALPEYPTSSNADLLLFKLYNIVLDTVSKGSTDVKTIVHFIVDKIVRQDQRHKEFNFAKLKAVGVEYATGAEGPDVTPNGDEDDEELDVFEGFDMDEEDIEDNVNGAVE